MDFKFVTFLDDEAPSRVEKLTVKFEADTSSLHEALDDVLDHVDVVNSALGGYLDEPAIGDIVSLASGSPDMTVISLCECGTAEVAWYDDNGMNIDVFPLAALILDDGE